MKDIPFTQARFVASAFDLKSFPKMTTAEGKPLPEIAFVGRSNVGKSSLINHLLRNSKLAKTSSTPGKTQSINFFSINEQLGLVDLPGYGYAKVAKEIKAEWAHKIDYYLQKRTTLKLILLLIDSRREPTDEDITLLQWAEFHQKPILLIFTKTDKMTDEQRKKNIKSSLEMFKNILHYTPTHFLHYSIKDSTARIRLIEKINTLLKEAPNGINQ